MAPSRLDSRCQCWSSRSSVLCACSWLVVNRFVSCVAICQRAQTPGDRSELCAVDRRVALCRSVSLVAGAGLVCGETTRRGVVCRRHMLGWRVAKGGVGVCRVVTVCGVRVGDASASPTRRLPPRWFDVAGASSSSAVRAVARRVCHGAAGECGRFTPESRCVLCADHSCARRCCAGDDGRALLKVRWLLSERVCGDVYAEALRRSGFGNRCASLMRCRPAGTSVAGLLRRAPRRGVPAAGGLVRARKAR